MRFIDLPGNNVVAVHRDPPGPGSNLVRPEYNDEALADAINTLNFENTNKVGVISMPYAASITPNAASSLKFYVTNVTGAITLNKPTNIANGEVLIVTFKRASGSGDLTLTSDFILPLQSDGVTPAVLLAMTVTAGHTNRLIAEFDSVSGKMKVASFLEYGS